MSLLDPQDRDRPSGLLITGDPVSVGDIPNATAELLAFGHIPNFDRLLPGDLVLMSGIPEPSIISRGQAKQFPQTAEWTHAAIFVPPLSLIEATRRGIGVANFLDYVPENKFRVRRPHSLLATDPLRAELGGTKIVLETALRMSTAKYGIARLFEIFLTIRDKAAYRFSKMEEESVRGIICSGLYTRAVKLALGEDLVPNDLRKLDIPVTPAMLAGISTLATIQVGYRKLSGIEPKV